MFGYFCFRRISFQHYSIEATGQYPAKWDGKRERVFVIRCWSRAEAEAYKKWVSHDFKSYLVTFNGNEYRMPEKQVVRIYRQLIRRHVSIGTILRQVVVLFLILALLSVLGITIWVLLLIFIRKTSRRKVFLAWLNGMGLSKLKLYEFINRLSKSTAEVPYRRIEREVDQNGTTFHFD